MRGRVWPLLLGVDVQLSPEAEAEYLELRCAKHRDSSVVECDVQRSLWTYTDGEQALDCLCLYCILPAYHFTHWPLLHCPRCALHRVTAERASKIHDSWPRNYTELADAALCWPARRSPAVTGSHLLQTLVLSEEAHEAKRYQLCHVLTAAVCAAAAALSAVSGADGSGVCGGGSDGRSL